MNPPEHRFTRQQTQSYWRKFPRSPMWLSRIPTPTPKLTFHQKLLRNKLMVQIHKNRTKNLGTTKRNPQTTHFLGLVPPRPGPAVPVIPGSLLETQSQTTPQAQNHNLHSDKPPGDSNARWSLSIALGNCSPLSCLLWPQEDYLEDLQYFQIKRTMKALEEDLLHLKSKWHLEWNKWPKMHRS